MPCRIYCGTTVIGEIVYEDEIHSTFRLKSTMFGIDQKLNSEYKNLDCYKEASEIIEPKLEILSFGYEDMKQMVYSLDLESLSHGIKVQELKKPYRFEAAGLGIINMGQFEYYGPNIEMYQIYSGSWNSPHKKVIKSIADNGSPENNPYIEYFKMIKDIEQKIINANNRIKRMLSKPNGYIFRGEDEQTLKNKLSEQAELNLRTEYEPVRPPVGIIHVGSDYADSWIWGYDAFYGWNIHTYRNVPSNIIKLK